MADRCDRTAALRRQQQTRTNRRSAARRGADRLTGCMRLALLLGTSTALTGCSLFGGNQDPPTATSPVQHPMLANVPLPNGFELVDDHSRMSSGGGVRFAQCEFVGKTPRGNVLEFFKEYMPTGGWQLRDERLVSGVYELRYDSERERCDVRVRQSGSRTHVEIDLRPASDGPMEREARPARQPDQ